jgi:hypothetical protein
LDFDGAREGGSAVDHIKQPPQLKYLGFPAMVYKAGSWN